MYRLLGFLAATLLLATSPTHAYEYSDAVLAKNPIGYWRLGDTGGSSAVDAAGGNDGNYHGNYSLGNPGPFAGQGDSDGALDTWNGGHGYVEIAHSADYLLSEGTYALWFYDDGHIGDQAGLFSKDSSGYDTGGHLSMYTRSDGRVELRMQSTSASYTVSSDAGSFNLNEWVHVAFTFGANGMQLYLDGQLVDNNSYTGGMTGNYEPIALGASTVQSGNGTIHNLTGKFSGLLDEFSIFDTALSASDIQDLYTGTVPSGGGAVPSPAPLSLLGLCVALLGRRLIRQR